MRLGELSGREVRLRFEMDLFIGRCGEELF